MATTFDNRINRLKSRRKGYTAIAGMDSMLESKQVLLNKSQQQEVWENRATGKNATRYALGAMQEVDPTYTRISIETAERIENQLKNRLSAQGIDAEFRLQGSVPLNIHIKGVSDVDLLAIDSQMFVYDNSGLKASTYTPTTSSSIAVLKNLRHEAEIALTSAFPAATVRKDNAKSIKVTGGSLSRDVDVVPSIWWNTEYYQQTNLESDRGVAILDKTIPEKILNTPFLHIKLITERCNITYGGLRKSIRMLKNIKADSEEEGTKINLSSFDIAAAMYHANDTNLQLGSYYELAILAETQRWLDYLYNNFEYAKTLDVPDGTRKIFNDEKKNGLLFLSLQVDDLLREVGQEISPYFTSETNIQQVRDIIKTIKVE
ncbi:hypothetical protein ACVSUC_20760 [Yersinia enterocolitica]|uniref:hypothetical protein n=1 Tax=Yersinia kristensenii TaxID=28152 RepID=UPI0005E5228E|nr:hypothetical protein [Yersinia kristensenii]CNF37056.1 Uncharacterised protein [Yersinia kristensenii]